MSMDFLLMTNTRAEMQTALEGAGYIITSQITGQKVLKSSSENYNLSIIGEVYLPYTPVNEFVSVIRDGATVYEYQTTSAPQLETYPGFFVLIETKEGTIDSSLLPLVQETWPSYVKRDFV